MPIVSLSERDRKAIILESGPTEIYHTNSNKYDEFFSDLHSKFCQSGGHSNIIDDTYTTGSCKFKATNDIRGIGFVLVTENIIIASVYLVWHKNKKKNVSKGDMNFAKNTARNTYKNLNGNPQNKLESFIDSAIEDENKLVFEC